MKRIDKIFGFISILIGLFSIEYHLSALIDYLLHPDLLRYFWYPYHFLIVQSIIGLLFIISGISILRNGRIFQKIYLLIGYFYLIVPFSDYMGRLLTVQSKFNVSCYLTLLLVYLIMSTPLIIYGNLKRFHVLNQIRNKFRINLILFLISVIVNGILYIFFGNYSVMC